MEENKIKALVSPELLIWARKKAGLTILDVVAKQLPGVCSLEDLGMMTWSLLAWEEGKAKPTIPEAQKLAEIYKIPFAIFSLPEPPKEPEILTLREIIKFIKKRELNLNDPLDPIEVLNETVSDLKRLEERIEGIQAEHTGRSIKSIGANWACGVNWACKEILGKEGDMNDSRG